MHQDAPLVNLNAGRVSEWERGNSKREEKEIQCGNVKRSGQWRREGGRRRRHGVA